MNERPTTVWRNAGLVENSTFVLSIRPLAKHLNVVSHFNEKITNERRTKKSDRR